MVFTVFSTMGFQPQDRADYWHNAVTDAYFPLLLHFTKPLDFQGRLARCAINNIGLSRLTSAPISYERRRRHIREAREEEYLITIPRQSPVEFRQLGRNVRCEPGGFILERGDEPYRFLYSDHNDLYVMKVSKKDLSERVRDPDNLCAQVFNGSSGIGALFTNMTERLFAEANAMTDGTELVLSRQLLELLSLALKGNANAVTSSASAVRSAHIKRVEDYIRQNLSDPALSPDIVAEACGISKRYLHDLFKDVNATVSKQIRDQRLLAARDRLEMPTITSIADISYRFGFSDQAHFSRLFRAKFGMSPSSYRQSLNLPPK